MKSDEHEWTVPGKWRAALATAIAIILLLVRDQVPYPWLEDLLHETGFALLVAISIYVIFETFSQVDQEQRWRRRIEQITGEVFYGVLRRNLPKALLKEANEQILHQVFIRHDLSLEYVLEDDTVDKDGKPNQYVKVSVALRFRIENISDDPQSLPIKVLVPNPLVPELKAKTDVTYVAYTKHGHRHVMDLAAAREKFKKDMQQGQEPHIKCEAPPIELESEEEVEVELRYVMAKEEEDAENFESLYPSDSIRLMITDRGPTPRRIRAGSHHPVELESQTLDGGPLQYRLNRYLLPHQGVLIWWKKS